MSQSSIPEKWVLPGRLRAGDTVAVCAPAGPVDPTRLKVGVAALEERYQVRIAPGIETDTGYLAGGDDHRIEQLRVCLADPEVRAVILARGGYGLTRILRRLDPALLRADPKLVVGYSDATALLGWTAAEAGVRSIHGPMAAHFGELAQGDRDWLIRLMEEPTAVGAFEEELEPIGASRAGVVEGPLWGGNLCMLSHMIGTPWEVRIPGSVLVLEEVGERPYAVDRYLTHLWESGAFAGVRAVLVGEFLRCDEHRIESSPTALEVVDERLRVFGIPGLAGAPLGHGVRHLAVPLGARCRFDFDARRFSVLEAAVR